MEGHTQPPQFPRPASDEPDERELVILERAVEKLMRLGELVGVSPEEMITLLDSGITVRELLDYLASKRSPHS